MSKHLRFPSQPGAPASEPKARVYSEQQKLISAVWQKFREVEAELPSAGQIGLWRKELYCGDGEKLLEDLSAMALRGLLKNVNYTAAVLIAGVERGEFGPRQVRAEWPIGQLDMSGRWRWNGSDWEPNSGEGEE